MLRIIELIKKVFRKAGNIFYVGATDILPEPLSKEKEDFYLSLFDFFKKQSDSFYTILFLILFNYLPHIYYLYLYPLKTILHTSSWHL